MGSRRGAPRRHPRGGRPDGLRWAPRTITALTRTAARSVAGRATTEQRVSAAVAGLDPPVHPGRGQGCGRREAQELDASRRANPRAVCSLRKSNAAGHEVVEERLEHQPQDEQLANDAKPLQSEGRGSRTAGDHPSGDGLLLAELAGLDESLRERGAAWKELVRRLDALRREVAVTRAQVQRSRSLAARKASRDSDADQEAGPSASTRDQSRATRLTQEFEAAQREAEERRVALHAEMDDLRRCREPLLRRLPAPLSRAYQSLTDAGRRPAIAAAAKGTCGGCEFPLPGSAIEALGHGAAVVCARCERLLHLARHVE